MAGTAFVHPVIRALERLGVEVERVALQT